ncbi:MAG TPA: tRNA pseudouridine(55) synthase TruB [Burkholderiales bacterium]|jgi:tRNA pseudouridine55 synthase|nr:tRNA pseudouridine(55) synthase TruB [Burkholderiales bacterium]
MALAKSECAVGSFRPMIHGVLLLDKPAGVTSNAALQRVRRLFGRIKAGHTGTLDPLATGLLPICLGEATKFSHSLLDADKTYEAVIRLGFVSSTGDAEGAIRGTRGPDFDDEKLQEVVRAFIGPILQRPPMHSALKKDGRPLYAYARAGIEVERSMRNVLIKDLGITDLKTNSLSIKVTCSKGTYIRVLAQDIGDALGCGGYLSALRRTRIADLDVASAIGLEDLERSGPAIGAIRVLPVDLLVSAYPALRLDSAETKRMSTGLDVRPAVEVVPQGPVRLYGPTGIFLGVGEGRSGGIVAPKRMLADPTAVPEKPANEQLTP